MRAVYIREFVAVDGVEFREVDGPRTLQKGEVLVRVRAAGVNRADLLQARGAYPPPPGYSPNIPGLEFAGEVAAVAYDATKWETGNRVFGITAGEAQAEYVVTHESLLAPIPEKLNFSEAACVPEAFITAHDALLQVSTRPGAERVSTVNEVTGALTSRDRRSVLIHAVGSGVGLAALQIAKLWDARVVGTSRTSEKLERCREFGLDAGISVTDPSDFAVRAIEANVGNHFDMIVDLVGGAYFGENQKALAKLGRWVVVGLTAGRSAEIDLGNLLQKRATITGTVLRPRSTAEKAAATARFVDEVLPHIASGLIVPNLDRAFPATEAADAYRYLASNESFGKVVLEF